MEETAAIFDGQKQIDDLQNIASVVVPTSIHQEPVVQQSQHSRQRSTLAEKSQNIPSTDDLSIAEQQVEAASRQAAREDLENLGLKQCESMS